MKVKCKTEIESQREIERETGSLATITWERHEVLFMLSQKEKKI